MNGFIFDFVVEVILFIFSCCDWLFEWKKN